MTGKDLYDLYKREMALQNIECDPWEDLLYADRHAWNAVAERVVSKY